MTMKAFVRTDPQTPEVKLAEMAIPEVDDHEVRVAVVAFGVGLHDRYFIPREVAFPYTIGVEGAGVVDMVGSAVTGVQVGDRVIVSAAMQAKGGTWAEYVVTPASAVTPIPDELDLHTAAGIRVAGGTAVAALHTLDLDTGDTLFVAGASGAVGTLAVQIAVQRGIRVAGSASPRNHDYLRELGAELAVDYRDPDWPATVRKWADGGTTAALAIQPGTGAPSQDVVVDNGHVVTVSGDKEQVRPGVRVEQFMHGNDTGEAMAALLADIAQGRIRLVLERVFAFEDAVAALEKTETRHARGKLVVSLDSDRT